MCVSWTPQIKILKIEHVLTLMNQKKPKRDENESHEFKKKKEKVSVNQKLFVRGNPPLIDVHVIVRSGKVKFSGRFFDCCHRFVENCYKVA